LAAAIPSRCRSSIIWRSNAAIAPRTVRISIQSGARIPCRRRSLASNASCTSVAAPDTGNPAKSTLLRCCGCGTVVRKPN
jgi:hypothetical protein